SGTATPNGDKKKKAPRKSNTPFQRIKPDEVAFAHDVLKDNSFESRGAGMTDYGAKASQDLIVTRGAGFRKEKNKKKRGSYRGGDITVSLILPDTRRISGYLHLRIFFSWLPIASSLQIRLESPFCRILKLNLTFTLLDRLDAH
ncbi:SRP40, C-terminal domain-containing protein, partial [Abortiporus biennis]